MIDTLLVGTAALYLVVGVLITARSWRRRDDTDTDAELINLAMDLNATGRADRSARAVGTALAMVVSVLIWPHSLWMWRRRPPTPPAEPQPETTRILRQPPPDDTMG